MLASGSPAAGNRPEAERAGAGEGTEVAPARVAALPILPARKQRNAIQQSPRRTARLRGCSWELNTPAHLEGCPRSHDYYNKNKDDASLPTMLSGYRTLAVFQGLA